MRYGIIAFAVIILQFSCTSPTKPDQTAPETPSFSIRPPLKDVNVPFEHYSVDAEKGDTLFHKTGSILVFPPNSFVDKAGAIVNGKIDVQYREFHDPLDYYLAGIPMEYDSAGKRYMFVSSGMCEITASKNNMPVFVNPASKPEINLASNSEDSKADLYYFDTTRGNWTYKGDMEIMTLPAKGVEAVASSEGPGTEQPEPPVKPGKANDKSPVLEVKIDPTSFGELRPYDNLKFQVDETQKRFDPKDSDEEWNDLELQKGDNKGTYLLKFSNAKRTITYAVTPVLEGKNYAAALKTYEKAARRYEAGLKKYRLKYNKATQQRSLDSLQQVKVDQENERIRRVNALVEARNRYIDGVNRRIDSTNKRIEADSKTRPVLRRFNIDGFGLWNCDALFVRETFSLLADFRDQQGNQLELVNIAVVFKNPAGNLLANSNNLKLSMDGDNMIWGVVDNRFAYIGFDDYRKIGLTSDVKTYTFNLTIVTDQQNNYEFIRSLVGQ